MKIRLLEQKDIESAAKIVGENYSVKYQELAAEELMDMFRPGAIQPKYFVAEDESVIVGFGGYVQSRMDYGIYEMYWINVHPDHQNKGIGKSIVSYIIEAIKQDPEAIEILLTASIAEGLPSYYSRHFGFKPLMTFGAKYQLMTLSLP